MIPLEQIRIFFEATRFSHPPGEPPPWANSVERWYQLDAYAYGFLHAFSRWKNVGNRPDAIVLASPHASNETDAAFVRSHGMSPTRFVHTLPNVRSAPLCQLLEWSGPVISVHRDPTTLAYGLGQAIELCLARMDTVWLLGALRENEGYLAYGFQIGAGHGKLCVTKREGPDNVPDDRNLLRRLLDGVTGETGLVGGYAVRNVGP